MPMVLEDLLIVVTRCPPSRSPPIDSMPSPPTSCKLIVMCVCSLILSTMDFHSPIEFDLSLILNFQVCKPQGKFLNLMLPNNTGISY